MTQRSTMPTDARSNSMQSMSSTAHIVVIHDKGETRKMSSRETPRERMDRVIKTIKKKQKKR